MKKLIPMLAVFMILMAVPLSGVEAQYRVEVGGEGFMGMVPCSADGCGTCELVTLANTVIRWLITTLFVVFAVIMVVAGFGLVTSGGSQSALEGAKSKFQNALIGIIIVLAAWLIVDTLLKGILAGGTGNIMSYGPWSEVQCTAQETAMPVREGPQGADPSQDVVAAPGTPPATPTAPGAPAAEGELTQAQAEALLAGRPITVVSSGNCTDASRSSCTSLDGVRANTLNRITELQSQVGVPFTITGGTETGHSTRGQYTHGNGYKIDLRPVPALNNYIYTNYTQIGPTTYRDPRGNTYYRHEPDHWDITITN